VNGTIAKNHQTSIKNCLKLATYCNILVINPLLTLAVIIKSSDLYRYKGV